MQFGILQRYVMGEVLRSFLLALMTITIVFVLFMVMTEATRMGLTPAEIAVLVPWVIPQSLPYTVPVSLLFAVTVVYGRLAGDNEVIAIKAAGLSAFRVIWPAISIGLVASLILLVLSGDAIPQSNHMARRAVFKSFEDGFYKFLKRDRELNDGRLPFLVKVKDVEGRDLIGATFKHRSEKAKNQDRLALARPAGSQTDDAATFDLVIQAKRARIDFDFDKNVAHVTLVGSDIQQGGKETSLVVNDAIEIPLPPDFRKELPKYPQQMTRGEIRAKQQEFRRLVMLERKRQSFSAALWLASGRVTRPDWPGFQRAFIDYKFWNDQLNLFETELQMRTAMAFAGFFFVLLGAPVGILFAKRDFLSAFISCFLPIILIYYPLMLGGMNLGKEGSVNPLLALWSGNVVLAVLSWFAIRPVVKH
ncbi:MAG: LptF/LptG family permease [Isosphaeraceae bacterium]|nr:LptF/LptG family permease [Isosphaeraceae bacterium]